MMAAPAENGGKLLAVGDPYQLPPVGQSRPSSFAQIPAEIELTQPMRYAPGSRLARLEQTLRYQPESFRVADWADGEHVIGHATRQSLVDAYVAQAQAAPAEDNRILFFRRADVLDTNRAVRAGLFSDRAAAPIVEDERLMVMSTTDVPVWEDAAATRPVMVPDYKDRLVHSAPRRYSGSHFLVDEVVAGEHLGVPCYMVRFDGSSHWVPVVFASGTTHTMDGMRGSEAYVGRLRELRAEALESGNWRDWRAFKNAFLMVGYRYAMTVHRAQGQSIDRVFFDPAALAAGGMSHPLLYVAGTRARLQVHAVQS